MTETKRISLFFGLAVLVLSLFLGTKTQAERDIIEIRFPVTDWQPFTIGNKPPFSGIDVDVAREIAKDLGAKLFLQYCPFKRCLAKAEKGDLDLISGIAYNDERATYLDYIREESYGAVEVAFYVKAGNRDILETYDDLKGMEVGMVRSSHYFEPFNSDTSLKKYEAHVEALLLPLLDSGRLQAIIGTNPNLAYQALQLGYKGKFEVSAFSPGISVPIYFAFSQKSSLRKLKPRIVQILINMKNDGRMNAIYDRYR